jgi:hypothetical protein
MCREQKTVIPQDRETGCPAGDRVEPEVPPGARSIETPETTGGDSGVGLKPLGELLKRMLGTDNMFAACDKVVRNLPRASGFLSGGSRRDDGRRTATVPHGALPGTD